jgi:hypothetical protein
MLRNETDDAAHASGPRLVTSSPRLAASQFMREATLGWGRRELAEWLMCHYGPCVIHRVDHCRDETPAHAHIRTGARPPHVDESSVIELVDRVRARMFLLLHDLGDPTQLAAGRITAAMIDSNRVEEIETRDGLLWRPVHRPRLRLVERVATLFVADYLNSPPDYRDVRACEQCGVLAFGRAVVHGRGCPAGLVRRDSHVAVRGAESPAGDDSDVKVACA